MVSSHEFRSNLGPKGVVVNNGSCSHNQEQIDDLDVILKMFFLEQKRNKCCKNFKPYIFSIFKNRSALLYVNDLHVSYLNQSAKDLEIFVYDLL